MVYRARADSTCSERIRAGRHDSRRPRKPTLLSWRLVRPYHHGTSFSRLRRAVCAPTPVLRYCAGTFERESGYPSCHHLIRDFIPTGWASLFQRDISCHLDDTRARCAFFFPRGWSGLDGYRPMASVSFADLFEIYIAIFFLILYFLDLVIPFSF